MKIASAIPLALLLLPCFGWGQMAEIPGDGSKVKPKAPRSRVVALVAEVRGDVHYLTKKINFTLSSGSLIPPGGEFRVPAKGQVVFRPMPGITGVIQENSSLKLDSLEAIKEKGKIAERKADLYLTEGSIYSALKKFNSQATNYQIQTPQAVAGAKGTEFFVSYRDGKGKIVVYSGRVKVTLRDKKQSQQELSSNQVAEIEGTFLNSRFVLTRPANKEELELKSEMDKIVGKYQDLETSDSNPFFTTTEATDRAAADPLEVPGEIPPPVPPVNPENTPANPVVSPVGP